MKPELEAQAKNAFRRLEVLVSDIQAIYDTFKDEEDEICEHALDCVGCSFTRISEAMFWLNSALHAHTEEKAK